jgi:hypothetical protein
MHRQFADQCILLKPTCFSVYIPVESLEWKVLERTKIQPSMWEEDDDIPTDIRETYLARAKQEYRRHSGVSDVSAVPNPERSRIAKAWKGIKGWKVRRSKHERLKKGQTPGQNPMSFSEEEFEDEDEDQGELEQFFQTWDEDEIVVVWSVYKHELIPEYRGLVFSVTWEDKNDRGSEQC